MPGRGRGGNPSPDPFPHVIYFLSGSIQDGRSSSEERKVRAPQGRTLGNTQLAQAKGECHRNRPPDEGKGEKVG